MIKTGHIKENKNNCMINNVVLWCWSPLQVTKFISSDIIYLIHPRWVYQMTRMGRLVRLVWPTKKWYERMCSEFLYNVASRRKKKTTSVLVPYNHENIMWSSRKNTFLIQLLCGITWHGKVIIPAVSPRIYGFCSKPMVYSEPQCRN